MRERTSVMSSCDTIPVSSGKTIGSILAVETRLMSVELKNGNASNPLPEGLSPDSSIACRVMLSPQSSAASRISCALGLFLQSPSAPSSPNDPLTGIQWTISCSSCHIFIVGVMCSWDVTSIDVSIIGRSSLSDCVISGVQFLRPIGAKKVTLCFGGVGFSKMMSIFGSQCPPSRFRIRSRAASEAHAPQAAWGPPPPIVTFASLSWVWGSPYLSSMTFPTTIT
mmetsp:Transcript_24951/g.60068  ORF Transcript_24951/g.60068 Transcript_24951/m.60068 type:complete len:224 (+) Transcript_24951:1399-2070(+)